MALFFKKKQQKVEETPENKEVSGIYPGMLLEVLTEDNRLIFVARIDWIEGNTVQISDQNEARLPPMPFRSEVKMRGFHKSTAITLQGVIIGNADDFWRIGDVQVSQQPDRRANFRQNTVLEAKVMCVNDIFGVQGKNTKPGVSYDCQLMDISLGGARIKTEGVFVDGDWLFIMDVQVIPEEPAFTFTCIVRRVIERGKTTTYGCQFYQLDTHEQERLVRGILTLQRKELQARRGTRGG